MKNENILDSEFNLVDFFHLTMVLRVFYSLIILYKLTKTIGS